MSKTFLAAVLVLLTATATWAEPVQSKYEDALVAVALASAKVPTDKAVSKADKSTGELIGTVVEALNLGSVCGVKATFLTLAVKKPYNFTIPAGATCAGKLASTCLGLRPGSRVRLQGIISSIPDVTADGFNACNPTTWEFLPAFAFSVTKVER
jgi:hypothetical protein